MPPAETYRDLLMHRGYGYPLWEPNPSDELPVELADVGYVEDGKFYRLFNARLPSDDPRNRRGAPLHYIPLEVEEDTLGSIPRLPFYLSSQTSSGAGADMSVTVSAPTPQGQFGGGGDFTVSRIKEAGALLCMNTDADRRKLKNTKHIQNYVLAHYKSWHAFATNLGRDVNPGDIRFVTGCDMTSDWACATWSSYSGSGSIGFNANLPVVRGQAHIWGRWETSDSVDYHAGPPRPPEPENNFLWSFVVSQITALVPSQITAFVPNLSTSGAAPEKNQCVFVRGYIVVERFQFRKRSVRTKAGEPFGILIKPIFSMFKSSPTKPSVGASQGGLSSSATNASTSDQETSAHLADEYDSDESDNSVDYPISLTDAMVEYIFKKSDADLALIHDEDVCHLFQDLSEPDFPVDYRQLVEERNPDVHVDDKVGMFSHSYALRYPLSGINIVKSTIVAESESSREDLEANTTSKGAANFHVLMDDISKVPDITDFVRKDSRYPGPIGRGTGGDVRVYRAVYERFGLSNMKVVVKQFRENDFLKSPEVCIRASNAWWYLDHPNVAKILGMAFLDPGQPPGVVSQYMRRNDILAYSKHRKQKTALEIASGLQYLHNNGIIHGNLKPNNILISDKGHAIVNFGISYTIGREYDPRYNAPELIPLQEVPGQVITPTTKSDMFSFGMLLLQLCHGRDINTQRGLPYNHIPDGLRLMPLIHDGERPKRERYRNISDDCWRIMTWCWNGDAALRPTIAQVVNSLVEARF